MATPEETIAALKQALQECADDLESEIEARYSGTKDHPAVIRKYTRDISTVRNARNLLRSLEPPPAPREFVRYPVNGF